MNLKEKGKTLNLGAGEVLWIENELFANNNQFISSDIEEKNLGKQNKAKKKLVCSATDIPLKNETLSQVILLDVLEHIKDHEKALSEIYRVLKKKGRFIICVPNDTLLSYLNPIRYLQHERHYTLQSITSLLKKHHYKIEKIHAGGKVWELADLYTHLFMKYTIRKTKKFEFFNALRDNEYAHHDPSGNEIAILARK